MRPAHAARGEERDLGPAAHAVGVELDVRAGQRAVALDVGTEHAAEPVSKVALDGLRERDGGGPRPAVSRERGRAVGREPHVEREREPLAAELVEPGFDRQRLRDRQAADHGAVRDRERAQELRARAQAAAELDLEPRRGAHPLDYGQVLRFAALRAVEIDDVQPARAELPVANGELDGVELVAGLAVEVPAQQPHAAPVAKVYRRNQLHVNQFITALSSENYRAPSRRLGPSVPGETACRRSCRAR